MPAFGALWYTCCKYWVDSIQKRLGHDNVVVCSRDSGRLEVICILITLARTAFAYHAPPQEPRPLLAAPFTVQHIVPAQCQSHYRVLTFNNRDRWADGSYSRERGGDALVEFGAGDSNRGGLSWQAVQRDVRSRSLTIGGEITDINKPIVIPSPRGSRSRFGSVPEGTKCRHFQYDHYIRCSLYYANTQLPVQSLEPNMSYIKNTGIWCPLVHLESPHAQARPGRALSEDLGLGLRNAEPEPAQARPKPGLSGQVGPRASLSTRARSRGRRDESATASGVQSRGCRSAQAKSTGAPSGERRMARRSAGAGVEATIGVGLGAVVGTLVGTIASIPTTGVGFLVERKKKDEDGEGAGTDDEADDRQAMDGDRARKLGDGDDSDEMTDEETHRAILDTVEAADKLEPQIHEKGIEEPLESKIEESQLQPRKDGGHSPNSDDAASGVEIAEENPDTREVANRKEGKDAPVTFVNST
ncbi:hypothetical protein C8R45DRAFT_945167 [Mycena sanguinolenta]|nr:hypothetical protein C8R45DRAFT_945167 [Mycena sanguinolenta]